VTDIADLQITNSKYCERTVGVFTRQDVYDEVSKTAVGEISIVEHDEYNGEDASDYLIYLDDELIGCVRGELLD